MKVFVTGATGFVGRHVAANLVERGHELRCLVRDRARAGHLIDAGHAIVEGGILDASALRDGVEGCDAVVHVAGLIAARSYEGMRAVNVTGSGLLASACRLAGSAPARVVLISSLAAGGPSPAPGVAVHEDAPPRPTSRYGLTKLDGERAMRRGLPAGTALTVIRPPAVYGPHDHGILEFFRAAAGGLRLRLGARRISIVHGADLARGIASALETPAAAGRTYYVANPESHSLDDLLSRIVDAGGGRGVPVPVPEFAVRAAGVIAEEVARLRGVVPTFSRDKVREFLAAGWVCDASRARTELGWTPHLAIDDGLRMTADWYREHGWIAPASR
jgi:nucleoside-diphosphate-sugar epimerase